MNLIRNILAVIGLFFVVLWLAGTLDIGNWNFYYGPDHVTCTKDLK